MKDSPAKKDFKKRFGQANHFLITALIGIDGVQKGIITEKPDSFRTSWNPKNVQRSAIRTRVFILQSFLGWAVESLEMYLTELNRKPKLLESEKFNIIFSKAGQSVYKKTILIGDELKIDPILISLMEVLITWRNYTFHYDIDNEIREESQLCLAENAEEIKNRFSGLDTSQLQYTWENNSDFTFKETASLIKATQDFVGEIDKYVCDNLNLQKYLTDTAEKQFSKNLNSKQRFVSFDNEKKIKYLKVLFQNIAGVSKLENELIEEVRKSIKIK